MKQMKREWLKRYLSHRKGGETRTTALKKAVASRVKDLKQDPKGFFFPESEDFVEEMLDLIQEGYDPEDVVDELLEYGNGKAFPGKWVKKGKFDPGMARSFEKAKERKEKEERIERAKKSATGMRKLSKRREREETRSAEQLKRLRDW